VEDRPETRRVAVALFVAIALLALLGAIVAWDPRPGLSRFDLDEERTVPAFFTGALLLACAALAFRLPRSIVSRGVAIVFAGLLVLGSVDELAEVHEKLERRLDVDWQLLYVPVFAAGVLVLTLFVAGLRRNGLSLALVLSAGACWSAAQVLEALQWEDDGPAPGYTWMMVSEETLEMAGSALLLFALLVVTHGRVDEPDRTVVLR
jgi:hypothetical protein